MTFTTRLPLLVILCLAGIGPARAVDVYKWTDEKGVVHFGDRRPGVQQGEKVPLREDVAPTPPAPPPSPARRPGAPPEPRITPLAEVSRSGGFGGHPAALISRCAGYARAAADAQAPARRQPMFQLIQSQCPGVGFKCVTINGQPEQNRCEPFAFDGKTTFFIDERKGFPVKVPELGRPDFKPMTPAPRPVPQA